MSASADGEAGRCADPVVCSKGGSATGPCADPVKVIMAAPASLRAETCAESCCRAGPAGARSETCPERAVPVTMPASADAKGGRCSNPVVSAQGDSGTGPGTEPVKVVMAASAPLCANACAQPGCCAAPSGAHTEACSECVVAMSTGTPGANGSTGAEAETVTANASAAPSVSAESKARGGACPRSAAPLATMTMTDCGPGAEAGAMRTKPYARPQAEASDPCASTRAATASARTSSARAATSASATASATCSSACPSAVTGGASGAAAHGIANSTHRSSHGIARGADGASHGSTQAVTSQRRNTRQYRKHARG
jgi:trimeric autotransporter adhesin